MQWWQVFLIFCGGPLVLFGAIWALVWLTTKPSAVPLGVALPSDAPSGGAPQGADAPPAAREPRSVHSGDQE